MVYVKSLVHGGTIVGCLAVLSCSAESGDSFTQHSEALLLAAGQSDSAVRHVGRKPAHALGLAARHGKASHRRFGHGHHPPRHCPRPSPDCELTISDGAVFSACSDLSGGVYTYADDGYSSIDLSDSTEQLCVAGHATQVFDEQWDIYWGAGLGLWVAQEVDGDEVPFDAAAEGVVGLGFTLAGAPEGGQLRLDLGTTGDDGLYCTLQWLQEGYNEVFFADIYHNCWEAGGSSVDITRLERIQWQVVTNLNFAFDFDFCVSDIKLLK